MGKRTMLFWLILTSFFSEEIAYKVKDLSTGIETPVTEVYRNNVIPLGLNYRYGGPVFILFFEIIKDTTQKDALSSALTSNKYEPGVMMVNGPCFSISHNRPLYNEYWRSLASKQKCNFKLWYKMHTQY